MMTMIKTYEELIRLSTFEERLKYLMLSGKVGYETFGVDRIFNQIFYKYAPEWKEVRNRVIVRDNGCDLGIRNREIIGEPIIVHHIEPITMEDLAESSPKLIDENNLISTRLSTHNIIHYGWKDKKPLTFVERRPNDTCPWKK